MSNNLLDTMISTRFQTPCCIGWDQAHSSWVTYDPREPHEGIEPEFFCTKGNIPFPLNDTARLAFVSLMVEQGVLHPDVRYHLDHPDTLPRNWLSTGANQ